MDYASGYECADRLWRKVATWEQKNYRLRWRIYPPWCDITDGWADFGHGDWRICTEWPDWSWSERGRGYPRLEKDCSERPSSK